MTTPKPFNPVVTEPEPCKVVGVYGDHGPCDREPVEDYYTAAQLRAYAASVARGMVGESIGRALDEDDYDTGYRLGSNERRAATLSAIDEWEKSHD